jgi:hypothetical protein
MSRPERSILLGGIQRSIEGNNIRHASQRDRLNGSLNLARARLEAQDVTFGM